MRQLRQWLGLDGTGASARAPTRGEAQDTETVSRIAAELDELEPERARYLAAFAYVLARVARADLDVTESETEEMVRRVRDTSGLPPAQAALVVAMARTYVTTLGGTENYLVTRQFRELSSRSQRVDLVRCLFSVAAADGGISSLESAEITQIGSELGFTREEVAGLRAAFREQLAVLKEAES